MQGKPNMCKEQRKGYVAEEDGGVPSGITHAAEDARVGEASALLID